MQFFNGVQINLKKQKHSILTFNLAKIETSF
jgi:hypothetical protein